MCICISENRQFHRKLAHNTLFWGFSTHISPFEAIDVSMANKYPRSYTSPRKIGYFYWSAVILDQLKIIYESMEGLIMKSCYFIDVFKIRNIWSWVGLGIALCNIPVRAEDPLLGEIKVIKCVGCEEGKVTLVIHDPIDVRDFDVTIMNLDYEKIVTPLPGKRVYDRGDGCFYWNETPKVTKKAAMKSPTIQEGNASIKKAGLANGKKGVSVAKAVDLADDSVAVANSIVTDSPISIPTELKQSKCIPYGRVALPKVGRQD